MTKYDKTTEIEGEVFMDMRRDTNKVIQALLKNMIEKKTYNGSVTIKVDIELKPSYVPIPAEEQTKETGPQRLILKPEIEHKVTSTMQIKQDEKGKYSSDLFCLVWNDEEGAYVMTPIKGDGQMTIFDVMDTEDVEGYAREANEQEMIEGEAYPMLPPPEEPDDGYDYDDPNLDNENIA